MEDLSQPNQYTNEDLESAKNSMDEAERIIQAFNFEDPNHDKAQAQINHEDWKEKRTKYLTIKHELEKGEGMAA